MSTVALFTSLAVLTMGSWIRVLQIPRPLLYTIVVAFCTVGTYSIHSSSFDLLLMFGFGTLGYVMRKVDVAIPPLLWPLYLQKIMEPSLRRALVQSDGNLLAFFREADCSSLPDPYSNCRGFNFVCRAAEVCTAPGRIRRNLNCEPGGAFGEGRPHEKRFAI